MSRRTYPRAASRHAEVASRALARHAETVGVPISLPVPIEMIVETTYRLEILWHEIPEPPGTVILGALAPSDRRILLNSRHEELFAEYMGPERFTLAHELAHWIYDADNPDQLSLNLSLQQPAEQVHCYRDSPGLSDDRRIREINANKLAAHLLLPEDLVLKENLDVVLGDLHGTAAKWGVSHSALRIRLRELGLIHR